MFALRLQNIWSRLLYLCIRKRSWVILKDETAVVQLSPVFRTRSICNTIGVGKLWWSILMANAQINLFVVFLKYHWETNLSSYLSFYSVKKKSVLFKPREKTNTNVDSKTNPKTFILTYRHQSDDPTKEDKPTKKKSHLDNDRKIHSKSVAKKGIQGGVGFQMRSVKVCSLTSALARLDAGTRQGILLYQLAPNNARNNYMFKKYRNPGEGF